jgi:hypothetical protein
MADYMAYSRHNKRSHWADRARAARLSGRFRNRLSGDVTGKDVEELKAALNAEGLSVATVNHHLKLLKAGFTIAAILSPAAGDGWNRPVHSAARWRLEESGNGPALRAPEP